MCFVSEVEKGPWKGVGQSRVGAWYLFDLTMPGNRSGLNSGNESRKSIGSRLNTEKLFFLRVAHAGSLYI